jgi:hypothetical protein
VAGKQHVFQIVTKERVWVMYADSAAEAETWVKLLTKTIQTIPEPGKKRKCEDCGINDAESKIAVKGRLMGLCKACCIQALADKDEAEADDRVLVCELCKFKFRSQELLDRHQTDWHTCAVCKKVCRTEAVAGGDGFVRKCFECSIGGDAGDGD